MNLLASKILTGHPLNDAEKLAVLLSLCGPEELPSMLGRIRDESFDSFTGSIDEFLAA